MDTQRMLSNGWNSMRDAGEAALNYPLVKQLPKVKEWVATGAGLAVAEVLGSVVEAERWPSVAPAWRSAWRAGIRCWRSPARWRWRGWAWR